jgi:hypothetical protein
VDTEAMKNSPPATFSVRANLNELGEAVEPADSFNDRWSITTFNARYARHQQRTRDRLQQRRLNATKRATQAQARLTALAPDLRDGIKAAMAQARARRAANRERLLHGFRWPGGYVNGKAFLPFTSRRLRSDLHPILRLFVARLPRAGRGLRSGTDKTAPWGHQGKLVQLDQPYVTFAPAMRGTIRIDLDRNFPSWAVLSQAIVAAGLPLPNFVVGHVAADGGVEHPHAYWLLAEAVCWTDNGRPGPQRLLRAIERGMVAVLRTAGADPGGLHNPLSGKNPLSELWTCQILAAAPFNLRNGPKATPGLIALTDHVQPVFGRAGHTAPAADGFDAASMLQQSNGLFRVLRRHVFATVAQYHAQGRDQGGLTAFVAATLAYARSLAPLCQIGGATLERRAQRAAEFAWSRFDGCSAQPPNRGRCQAACQGKSLSERQRIGALDVAARKRDATIDRLVAAHRRLVARGSVPVDVLPTNAILAAEAGVAVRTLQKHRAAVLAALQPGDERRCLDKRQSFSSSPTTHSVFLFQIPKLQQSPAPHTDLGNQREPGGGLCPPIVSAPAPVQPLLTIESPACPAPVVSGFPSSAPGSSPSPLPLWPAGFDLFPGHLARAPSTAIVPRSANSPASTPPPALDAALRQAGLTPTAPGVSFRFAEAATSHCPPPCQGQREVTTATSGSGAVPLVLSGRTNPPTRTRRNFAPGFLEAQAAREEHHATVRRAVSPAPSPTARQLHPRALLAQTRQGHGGSETD